MLINAEENNCGTDSPLLYTQHDQLSISSIWEKEKQQFIYDPFKEFHQASNQTKIGIS